MSIVTLFDALLWVAAVAVLVLGFWFLRARISSGRWLAAGIAILEPGQLLSTYAEYHEWSPRRQIAVNYFELVCDLAYVVCTAVFLVQIARAREKGRQAPAAVSQRRS